MTSVLPVRHDSGYATCEECGNPLNDGEDFRGVLCEGCKRAEHEEDEIERAAAYGEAPDLDWWD